MMLLPAIHTAVLLFHVLIGNFSNNSVCSIRYISEGKGGMRVKSREGGNFSWVRELYLPLAQIRDTR